MTDELDRAVVGVIRIVVETHVRQDFPVLGRRALARLERLRERGSVTRRRDERHAAVAVVRHGVSVTQCAHNSTLSTWNVIGSAELFGSPHGCTEESD